MGDFCGTNLCGEPKSVERRAGIQIWGQTTDQLEDSMLAALWRYHLGDGPGSDAAGEEDTKAIIDGLFHALSDFTPYLCTLGSRSATESSRVAGDKCFRMCADDGSGVDEGGLSPSGSGQGADAVARNNANAAVYKDLEDDIQQILAHRNTAELQDELWISMRKPDGSEDQGHDAGPPISHERIVDPKADAPPAVRSRVSRRSLAVAFLTHPQMLRLWEDTVPVECWTCVWAAMGAAEALDDGLWPFVAAAGRAVCARPLHSVRGADADDDGAVESKGGAEPPTNQQIYKSGSEPERQRIRPPAGGALTDAPPSGLDLYVSHSRVAIARLKARALSAGRGRSSSGGCFGADAEALPFASSGTSGGMPQHWEGSDAPTGRPCTAAVSEATTSCGAAVATRAVVGTDDETLFRLMCTLREANLRGGIALAPAQVRSITARALQFRWLGRPRTASQAGQYAWPVPPRSRSSSKHILGKGSPAATTRRRKARRRSQQDRRKQAVEPPFVQDEGMGRRKNDENFVKGALSGRIGLLGPGGESVAPGTFGSPLSESPPGQVFWSSPIVAAGKGQVIHSGCSARSKGIDVNGDASSRRRGSSLAHFAR
jgi:hypothetical protein